MLHALGLRVIYKLEMDNPMLLESQFYESKNPAEWENKKDEYNVQFIHLIVIQYYRHEFIPTTIRYEYDP